jgi:hypothetical protein
MCYCNRTMKKVYYAHPITLYNTQIEKEDIKTLTSMGFEVYNPNSNECDEGYNKHGMQFFQDIIAKCDGVVFRSFPDGSIPAGVAKEIGWAEEYELFVLELPRMVTSRTLGVNETRTYLKEMGRS